MPRIVRSARSVLCEDSFEDSLGEFNIARLDFPVIKDVYAKHLHFDMRGHRLQRICAQNWDPHSKPKCP